MNIAIKSNRIIIIRIFKLMQFNAEEDMNQTDDERFLYFAK